jgi:hypothetical protein
MAYQGPERATMALISRLNSSLAATLAEIKSERADNLTVPTPDRWTDERQDAVICQKAQIEVYETRGRMDYANGEWSTWGTGTAAAVTTICNVTVRLSWFMREGETRPQMRRMGRRYLQALIRICRDYPDLDDRVEWIKPGDWDLRPVDAQSEDGKRSKLGQLTLETEIKVSETASNEGVAGGSRPVSPGATLT